VPAAPGRERHSLGRGNKLGWRVHQPQSSLERQFRSQDEVAFRYRLCQFATVAGD
jgi:hypothetical protein